MRFDGNGDQFQQVRKFNPRDVIRWKNTTEETVPAYGVVQIGQWDDTDKFFSISKPTSDGTLWYINGPVDVPVDSFGSSSPWVRQRVALVDTLGYEPVGKVVGPVAGQWEMSLTGSGFIVVSPEVDGKASIIWKGGVGGGVQIIMFEITEPIFCDLCSAVANIVMRPPGVSTVPEETAYGTVTVHDFAKGNLSGASVDLVGLKGFAAYLEYDEYRDPFIDCAGTVSGKYWTIISLFRNDTRCTT